MQLSGQKAFHGIAHPIIGSTSVKKVLFLFKIPKTLMDMSPISRKFTGLFGHKTGEDPVFFSNLLYGSLKKHGPISSFENIAILYGRFRYPWPRLGMEPFQRHPKTFQLIKESVKEVPVFGHPQNGIPKHARCQRQRCLETLFL